MRAGSVIVLVLALGCASAPAIAQVDTTADVKRAQDAAKALDSVKPGTTEGAVAVQRAQLELTICADSLQRITKKNNSCVDDYQSLKEKFKESQEQGGSWWTRLKLYWHFALIIVCAVVGSYLAGWLIGPLIWSMSKGAFKAALHIP